MLCPNKLRRISRAWTADFADFAFPPPRPPPIVQAGGGVELGASTPPSVLRARTDYGGRLFAAKLAVVVHCLSHQVLNHLLANGAVLALPPPIAVQRSHGFTRPTTRRGAECAPPTVKPLYLQIYFRLAASGSRGKAAADNQSLRLHRPQAPVSPTAVS